MSARIRAADDTAAISRRIAELRAESAAALNCTCRRSDDGAAILSASCPTHSAVKYGEAASIICGLSPACLTADTLVRDGLRIERPKAIPRIVR